MGSIWGICGLGGALGAYLGPVWGLLGIWVLFEPWGPFGAFLKALGVCLSPNQACLGPFGTCLGRWGLFGARLGMFGPLGLVYGHSGVPWCPLVDDYLIGFKLASSSHFAWALA